MDLIDDVAPATGLGSWSGDVPRVRPVDRLVAVFNGIFALLWLGVTPSAGYGLAMAAVHGTAALALPWLLARLDRRPSRSVRVLREIYPLAWIGAYWTELDYLIDLLHTGTLDAAARQLDLAIFGVHLNEIWMPAMPQVWLSEVMHFAYFLYYPLIFVPPLAMLVMGRGPALRDMVLRLMVTYLGCYLLYLLFPVYGPHFLSVRHAGPLTDGFFYQLVELAHAAGDSRGTALPSSHVAGATTIAVLGWRWLGSTAARVLTVQAVAVALATVYTQNHYAVDAVAGVVWALLLQASVPALVRVLTPSRGRDPVPVLPVPAPDSKGVR